MIYHVTWHDMIKNKVANKDKNKNRCFFYIQKSDFNVLLRSVNLVHREKNVIRNQSYTKASHSPF